MSLTDAMHNFLNDASPQNESELITQLKKAEFLSPIMMLSPLAKPDGSAVYEEEGANIKFMILADDEANLSFFPAFTSREEMMKWRNDAEQEVLNLRLRDFCAMINDSGEKYAGVVIDAFGANLILNAQILNAIVGD